MKNHKIIIKNLIWPFVAVILLSVLWYISSLVYDNSFILPQPNAVFGEMKNLLAEKNFWYSFSATLFRCVMSLSLSFLFSLILAIFSILYLPFCKLLAPIITILRSIPTMSVIFVLILVFTPNSAPIFVTFLVVMPTMYSMLISSFMGIEKEFIETGRVFGYNKFDEVTKIYMPLSLPVMIESIAGGFSLSFKILVAAEVLSSTAQSMGYMLKLAKSYVEIPRLFAITLVAIIVCIIVEMSLRFINERLSKDLR